MNNWGGRREGAGGKPTCTCGECRICVKRNYTRLWRSLHPRVTKESNKEIPLSKEVEEVRKRFGWN